MPKQIYEMSSEANLKLLRSCIDGIECENDIVEKITKEIIAEDDPFGGHDTGQRILTVYYKVNIKGGKK